MNRADLILWGGTGHARVLRELADDEYRIVAVIDRAIERAPFADLPVLRDGEALRIWLANRAEGVAGLSAAIAIGGANGRDRRSIGAFLAGLGINLPSFVHRTARLARDCTIGTGSQILLGALVSAQAKIGDFVILNSGAQIDHDCVVEHGAHLGPGVVVAGETVIGENAFIGTGAVIHPRILIGQDAVVAAGATVISDVAPGTLVAGSPAILKRRYEAGVGT